MKPKKNKSFGGLFLIIAILFIMGGCGDSDGVSVGWEGEDSYYDEGGKPCYTFAVISDSHIIDTTVLKDTKNANNKLRHLGDELSKDELELDFVVHTGDHVNDLYCPEVKDVCLFPPTTMFGCTMIVRLLKY